MKRIFIILGLAMAMSLNVSAQVIDEVDIVTDENVNLETITPAEPVQESKKEIKEREKRVRELNDDVAFAKASNSLRRGYFVLLVDDISIGRMGYRISGLTNNSNFVLVQDEDGIIQYAFSRIGSGNNGLGGWTGKGTVRNKKLSYAKNGDVYLQYQLVCKHSVEDVYITLYHNSNHAVADIRGSQHITVYGRILPYRDKDHR